MQKKTLFFQNNDKIAKEMRNIVAKLDIHSQTGLSIYAIANNLVDLSEVKTVYRVQISVFLWFWLTHLPHKCRGAWLVRS